MELNLVPARDDRADDVCQKARAIDQRRHRIDEEHAGQAVRVEAVDHPADAVIALRRARIDRRGDIVGQRHALLMQARRQFGVDGDQDPGHAAASSPRFRAQPIAAAG